MGALLPTDIARAAPLRKADGLLVTCRIEGLPRAETAAAEAALCARVAEAARHGAPFPVAVVTTADNMALRLAVRAEVRGATPAARTLLISAELARPAQPAAPRRVASAAQPVIYRDQAAVDAAIDAALAAVLPWRNARRAPVPSPPRNH